MMANAYCSSRSSMRILLQPPLLLFPPHYFAACRVQACAGYVARRLIAAILHRVLLQGASLFHEEPARHPIVFPPDQFPAEIRVGAKHAMAGGIDFEAFTVPAQRAGGRHAVGEAQFISSSEVVVPGISHRPGWLDETKLVDIQLNRIIFPPGCGTRCFNAVIWPYESPLR